MKISPPNKSIIVIVVCLMLSPVVLFLAAWLFGLRFNNTGSAPVGVYRSVPGPPELHDYVMLDLTGFEHVDEIADRGYFERNNGRVLLCKIVHGLPGDTVDLDSSGNVLVNGVVVPNSIAHRFDDHGRPLYPRHDYPYVIPDNHFLVFGISAQSYDSRYYGPIPIDRVQSRMLLFLKLGVYAR